MILTIQLEKTEDSLLGNCGANMRGMERSGVNTCNDQPNLRLHGQNGKEAHFAQLQVAQRAEYRMYKVTFHAVLRNKYPIMNRF
jgi:outer membrane lipopolysaccharide assembly protein LptE/RlpB